VASACAAAPAPATVSGSPHTSRGADELHRHLGAPRSGGRRQGVDMFAPLGTRRDPRYRRRHPPRLRALLPQRQRSHPLRHDSRPKRRPHSRVQQPLTQRAGRGPPPTMYRAGHHRRWHGSQAALSRRASARPATWPNAATTPNTIASVGLGRRNVLCLVGGSPAQKLQQAALLVPPTAIRC
jgi:hypothetical protein